MEFLILNFQSHSNKQVILLAIISGHFAILVKICTKKAKICIFSNKNVFSGNSETVQFLQKLDFSATKFNIFDFKKWHFLIFFANKILFPPI